MKQPDLIQTLKNHYEKNSLSQEDLARQIGVSWGTINRWFNGNKTKMHKATEIAIQAYLRNAGILK